MARKKKKFVVGFDNDFQVIYGKQEALQGSFEVPMTWRQAERRVQKLIRGRNGRPRRVIYELVVRKEID